MPWPFLFITPFHIIIKMYTNEVFKYNSINGKNRNQGSETIPSDNILAFSDCSCATFDLNELTWDNNNLHQ